MIDLEVASVLRRQLAGNALGARRAHLALTDLNELPMHRAPHLPLLPRCWELRENLTVYEASYVALAELLGAPLLTADARLARCPSLKCPVELLD